MTGRPLGNAASRDHQTDTARPSPKSAANRYNPADLNRRRHRLGFRICSCRRPRARSAVTSTLFGLLRGVRDTPAVRKAVSGPAWRFRLRNSAIQGEAGQFGCEAVSSGRTAGQSRRQSNPSKASCAGSSVERASCIERTACAAGRSSRRFCARGAGPCQTRRPCPAGPIPHSESSCPCHLAFSPCLSPGTPEALTALSAVGMRIRESRASGSRDDRGHAAGRCATGNGGACPDPNRGGLPEVGESGDLRVPDGSLECPQPAGPGTAANMTDCDRPADFTFIRLSPCEISRDSAGQGWIIRTRTSVLTTKSR